MKNKIILLFIVLVALVLMAGCSITSLQCGTDGQSSFVFVTETPRTLSQNARVYAQLCSFAYEQEQK